MKATVKRAELLGALEKLRLAIVPKPTLSILASIRVEAVKDKLVLVASNLETTLVLVCPARVAEAGAVCLAFKPLLNFLGKAPGELVDLVETRKPVNQVRQVPVKDAQGNPMKDALGYDKYESHKVRVMESTYKVVCPNPEMETEAVIEHKSAKEYPPVPEVSGGGFALENFAEALKRVLPAMSTEDARPILQSAFLNRQGRHLEVTTADGFQLASQAVRFSGKTTDICIPAGSCYALVKLLGKRTRVSVQLSKQGEPTQALFESDGMKIYSALVFGKYPNYRQLIPKGGRRFEVERAKLIKAVRFLSGLGFTGLAQVRLLTKSGQFTVSSDAATVKVPGARGNIRLAVDPKFPLNALEQLTGERVTFFLGKNPVSPVKFAEPGYTYLVMPMSYQWPDIKEKSVKPKPAQAPSEAAKEPVAV